jgi:hypothetical protein
VKRIAAALIAVAALSACSEEAGKFPVVITVVTDDGKPMPDLPVTIGRSPAGRTDAEGKLKVRVVGKEGQKLTVGVTVPKGFRAATPDSTLVLRRLAGVDESNGRPLPIEHVVKLSPLEREYAVLVRVGVAGLPILTFGTQQAVTNDKGVAMFLYRGAPGDELQVKIDTSAKPELRPQNPQSNFLLVAKPEAYVVKEKFTVYKAPVKHHKPVHVGPTRL